MGAFANTVFSALLGWVQTAAAWLWGLVTNADVSAWLRWLLDNWLPLLLILCAGGVVIDFIVYLIRWQPYRVWGRFLRRMTGKEESPAEKVEKQPVLQRRWLYADGSTAVEEVHEPLQDTAPQDALDAPIRPVRRVVRRSTPEQAYNQPVYPPQWRHDQQGENK